MAIEGAVGAGLVDASLRKGKAVFVAPIVILSRFPGALGLGRHAECNCWRLVTEQGSGATKRLRCSSERENRADEGARREGEMADG